MVKLYPTTPRGLETHPRGIAANEKGMVNYGNYQKT